VDDSGRAAGEGGGRGGAELALVDAAGLVLGVLKVESAWQAISIARRWPSTARRTARIPASPTSGRPARPCSAARSRPSTSRARRLRPVPPHAGADARGVRAARLADGRRVPDAQPDPSRARISDEGRARNRRRPAPPPARRRERKRTTSPPTSGCAATRRSSRTTTPPPAPPSPSTRPRCATRARKRPSSTPSSARISAAPISSSARPRGRRLVLRDVRRAEDLGRVHLRGARDRPAQVREQLLVPEVRRHGQPQDLRARRSGPRLAQRDEGARAPGEGRNSAPSSSRGRRWRRS